MYRWLSMLCAVAAAVFAGMHMNEKAIVFIILWLYFRLKGEIDDIKRER